mgnify:CR=1 FL=1
MYQQQAPHWCAVPAPLLDDCASQDVQRPVVILMPRQTIP